MSIKDEFATRNFSIYGQWLGILSMILCFALGIANFFNLFHILLIIFAIICLVSSFVILFLEVPLLLRICPTSSTFDAAIRKISTNYARAGAYGVLALVQYLSIIVTPSSLIAAAVVLTFTAICYALAGLKGQAFVGSKTLGGQGVAQMII
ncbi:putative Golgi apparatus membrane protein TVP18 [Rosellinia necatrix]|uniref:Putative Golgi apparatus membrane protein TVP18 n=1 Tax=Rosellinia necatrix TaxID=77044 RepID=A0A1W2TRY8_ROSNE|nr:putative Golgi apparatus membrane protein TVP18 [Rosellinia necatrix]